MAQEREEKKEQEVKTQPAPVVRRRRSRPADGPSAAAAAPVAQRRRTTVPTTVPTPFERDARSLEIGAFTLLSQLESFATVRTTFMMAFTVGCVVFL